MFTLKFRENVLLKNNFTLKPYHFRKSGNKSEVISFLETPSGENTDIYNNYFFFSISSEGVDDKKYIPIHLFEINEQFLDNDTEESIIKYGNFVLIFIGNDDISFARRFKSKQDAFNFINKYNNSTDIDSFLDKLYVHN